MLDVQKRWVIDSVLLNETIDYEEAAVRVYQIAVHRNLQLSSIFHNPYNRYLRRLRPRVYKTHDVHVQIKWKNADAFIKQDGPIVLRVDFERPQPVNDKPCKILGVFRQAYLDDGLKREEYADYGPVQLFRNAFMMGWFTLLAEVSKRRNALAI